MGVTAALAGMLLVALPGGAAYAVDDVPADDVPAVQVDEVAPVEELAPSESDTEPAAPAADDVPAEPAEPAADAAAESATAPPAEVAPAPQTAEAPVAAAVQGNGVLTGKVTFPSGATQAQRESFRVFVYNREPRVDRTFLYKDERNNGQPTEGFQYNPTTGKWTVTGLETRLYDSVNFGIQNSELEIYTINDVPGVDLRSGTRPALNSNATTGAVMLAILSLESTWKQHRVYLTNVRTGAVTDATNMVRSGSSSPGRFHRNHSVEDLMPEKYQFHVVMKNGVKIYYDGTATGTIHKSEATTISVPLLRMLHLKVLDLRDPVFADIPEDHKFFADTSWMAAVNISTGVKQANGSVKYLPKASVSREAMIGFLYRLESPKNYKAPSKSPFTDVKPGHKFYKQIMWAYENKVTTGIKLPNGQRKFAPSDRISREAMAAFMFRQYKSEIPTQSGAKKLADVPKGHKFYKEITWMSSNGITTGVKRSNGTLAFAPKDRTSREATAAFLHRAEVKK